MSSSSNIEDSFESNLAIKDENFEVLSANGGVIKDTHQVTASVVNDKSNTGEIDQLEYDEDFSCLVSEEETTKIGNSQFTADNLIDEDFEAELGATANILPTNLIDSDVEKRKNSLRERIDRFGIVKVCGSDANGRPVIILAASRLPNSDEILKENEFFSSHQQFFDLLLEILSNILERYVESEYTLVYLHYGLKSTSQPSFNWLAKVYKMLDRKFKKNLKALYVVHPSTLFKLLWAFIRPLISSKFIKKVTYCNTLNDLAKYIDLNNLNIPEEVKLYDMQLKQRKASMIANSPSSLVVEYGPYQQFKVPLEHIAKINNGDCIPLCVKETIVFLRKNIEEEGLFRKSGSFERIKQIISLYNEGQPVAYDQWEYHVAACVLKAFFRELPESLLPDSIFNEMMSLQALDVVDKVEVAKDLLNRKLPSNNYKLLNHLISFLYEVTQHSAKNKMDAKNLSYVFGPNFLRKKNDADFGLIDIERINLFIELLIKYHSEIFNRDEEEANSNS